MQELSQEKLQELMQERRRSIRLRRSALLKAKLDEIDRPNIKIAETAEELCQSFSLVYREYVDSGYIQKPHPSGMSCSMYNFLPTTCVFIFRSFTKVISTLTQIVDTKEFGLPLDSLYHTELNELRAQGRKISEISALATPKEARWNNLLMFLTKTVFEYSQVAKINDVCVMVNPKHVSFYKTMFLFEDFGPERYYPQVGAPAVALRVNVDRFAENLEEKYKDFDLDSNMHQFFCKMNSTMEELHRGLAFYERHHPLPEEDARFFFHARPDIFAKCTVQQKDFLLSHYPFLQL